MTTRLDDVESRSMFRGTLCLLLLLIVVLVSSGACAPPVEVSANRGQELYLAYGCAACHGANGDGQGPGASRSTIPPRDLRDLSSYVGGTSVDDIATTIEYGMKATNMPAYTDLPPDERLSIATWIVSIAEEK